MSQTRYRLVRRPTAGGVPVLDADQRRVVDHPGGPLLVLAGPGTGKTTTLVEAVVDRIERRGVDPEHILVLTFSRKAAHELRERIGRRLAATTRRPLACTFHSYAYALLTREYLADGDAPPRLLSGPEQLHEVRELLAGEAEDSPEKWPARLRPTLTTRGFADELRDLIARTRERGVDPARLTRLGRSHGRDDWVAAAAFMRRYADRFAVDPLPTHDYAELIVLAAGMLAAPEARKRERAARQLVFVDEYQDTDPAQEALLSALAGDGRDLVAFGDPDQSIYAFRGADVRGILEFPDRFRTVAGEPAPVVALRTSRRSGGTLLTASRQLARKLPAGPGAGGHRDIVPAAATVPGEVRKLIARTANQEAALVADVLRRAHLLDGVAWSRMAVLVRSATRQLPVLRRAMMAAGVPVAVAGDEAPLKSEPGVAPLLALLRAAVRPDSLDQRAAEELLTGPIGEADVLALRRLQRALERTDRAAGGDRPGATLLVDALNDPRELTLIEPDVRAPADRIVAVLGTARQAAAAGASVEDVLWAIWTSSGLPQRWQAASAGRGQRAAAADRDLDAVVALFDAAARFVDRLPHAGAEVFLETLEGQEIPGDTLAERAPTSEMVRILTAHRAKGLEWDVVVVAGAQEGTWPDLRLRGSLLGADELVDVAAGIDVDAAGAASTLASRLLNEERRLFYVAATRARRRLVVTAVGGDDADERPSRFLSEIAPEVEAEHVTEGMRWLSLPALVADLRSVVTDPSCPLELRRVAAARLARLAAAGVPRAHPDEWYALTELSDPGAVASTDEQVRVSPSQVEQFTRCGLRWLLEAAVGARAPDVVRHLGTVIHAVATLAATEGAEQDALSRRLDEIWTELDFGSVWYSHRQREVADEMVRRFLDWQRANPRELIAAEQAFTASVGQVRVTGRVDRVERDGAGRAVVVDLKTGSSKPGDDELDRHAQLGVYQLAVLLGAFERFGLVEPGGAELVQLGPAAFKARARVQAQPPVSDDPEPDWAAKLVETVAAGMSGSVFQATLNEGCRTCPVRGCCPVHDEGAHVTG